jgi:hypothetical protein
MSNLVSNIEDLRNHIRCSSDTTDVSEFTFGIDSTIEKYLLPVLGQTILDHIEDYCLVREETPDTILEKLRLRILRAFWPFQIAEIAQELAVVVSGMGISVTRTENVAPVSDEKLAALKTALYNRGYFELESLSRFLTANASHYPEWKVSDNLLAHFFNYADELTRFILLTNAPFQFNNLKPAIERIESTVLAEIIGVEVVQFLQQQLYNVAATLNIRNAIYHCRCIVAYHVAVEELSMQSYHARIEQATNSLLACLRGNPEDFPGYVPPVEIDNSNLSFFNTIP